MATSLALPQGMRTTAGVPAPSHPLGPHATWDQSHVTALEAAVAPSEPLHPSGLNFSLSRWAQGAYAARPTPSHAIVYRNLMGRCEQGRFHPRQCVCARAHAPERQRCSTHTNFPRVKFKVARSRVLSVE